MSQMPISVYLEKSSTQLTIRPFHFKMDRSVISKICYCYSGLLRMLTFVLGLYCPAWLYAPVALLGKKLDISAYWQFPRALERDLTCLEIDPPLHLPRALYAESIWCGAGGPRTTHEWEPASKLNWSIATVLTTSRSLLRGAPSSYDVWWRYLFDPVLSGHRWWRLSVSICQDQDISSMHQLGPACGMEQSKSSRFVWPWPATTSTGFHSAQKSITKYGAVNTDFYKSFHLSRHTWEWFQIEGASWFWVKWRCTVREWKYNFSTCHDWTDIYCHPID